MQSSRYEVREWWANLERQSKRGAKFSESESILEGESITLSHRGDIRGEIKKGIQDDNL